MPWNSDGGGGNQGGPWGQGPWGQGPRRPNQGGGRGPTPPDLDDLIRKGQDKLKQVLPSGGGRFGWIVPVILVVAFVVYNSIYQVQPDERGVVLRFGAYDRTVAPGLHFALWPVETMETPRVEAENQINFGGNDDEGLMLAGDQNIVDIEFTALWRISDPKNYLFEIQTPQEAIVRDVAESAMREIVGRTAAEIIRTTGRQKAQDEVRDIIQRTLDSYNAGIAITSVNLQKADPPKPVLAAFEEVQRAEQNQAQSVNEADQYRNRQLRQVEGETAKLIQDAEGYKARVVADAKGESARFLSIYNQYKNAKGVTRERIFLETMEQIMSDSNKVIIEQDGGQGVVPYLPLPAIQNQAGNGTGGNP
ncbi:MAG TPA: FtsH protease activity modulator HflK [Aestuariivirga sp.]|nr:FtsH protease activity modulator HflK [Alphaproteobacteria bacterium]HRX37240.1 FtsH protease activity modulator HflK [Aestuariivirga sp.]